MEDLEAQIGLSVTAVDTLTGQRLWTLIPPVAASLRGLDTEGGVAYEVRAKIVSSRQRHVGALSPLVRLSPLPFPALSPQPTVYVTTYDHLDLVDRYYI